ncbi:TlpA disulfide reductase family protein [Pedobacter sp. MC2016-05]|uniref:TlpA family protein disulfide reductase n=1 Tax=Pedobacter sp. MC2016-05 TaxID=2994474 RepID=UPI0022468C47|nr:TlpA disulfide reductase family protein [Pedobacter sp. MC2016-05]MCX2477194.1 TlpA disulfide reductase family protein [Pedobacter sp. MC2016-05]
MKQTTISIVRGELCLLFHGRSMKIFTFFSLVLAFYANMASAQVPRSADELVVGQRIPDDLWDVPFRSLRVGGGGGGDGVLKGKGFEPAVLRLRELKGRLIILDFWATWCGGCIAGFPKAKKLQERFGEEVSFVLVNNEDPLKAERLLSRRLAENGEVFRYVNSDTLLNRLFFKRLIPHYVWIDGSGKVMAVTGGDELTEDNISLVLSGGDGVSGIRNVLDIDRELPLFSSPDLSAAGLMKYSLLTKGKVAGLPSGFLLRKDKVTGLNSGLAITNLPFWYIYKKLFAEFLIETKDFHGSDRLVYEGRDRCLLQDTFFNYEFSVSGPLISRLDSLMLADLNTFSPFRFALEKRRVKTLSLGVVDSTKLPRVKVAGKVRGGAAESHVGVMSAADGGAERRRVRFEKVRMRELVYLLKEKGLVSGTVVYGTFSDVLVSLELSWPGPAEDSGGGFLEGLNRQLSGFGMRLTEGYSELNYGVIRDQMVNLD